MNTNKTCTRCNTEYAATLEYFYYRKNTKSNLASWCVYCSREYALNNLAKMTPSERFNMKKAEQQRNAHTYRQATRKIIARKRGVVHEDWTEKQLLETYGKDCYICNKAIDFNAPKRGIGSEYSFWPDHVIPTSRGGSNTLDNVRPCHAKCNRSKGIKTHEEYIKYLEELA
jgi:hypothetical protein